MVVKPAFSLVLVTLLLLVSHNIPDLSCVAFDPAVAAVHSVIDAESLLWLESLLLQPPILLLKT
jgi:hypothetical protein